jgi:hypothetical protein
MSEPVVPISWSAPFVPEMIDMLPLCLVQWPALFKVLSPPAPCEEPRYAFLQGLIELPAERRNIQPRANKPIRGARATPIQQVFYVQLSLELLPNGRAPIHG